MNNSGIEKYFSTESTAAERNEVAADVASVNSEIARVHAEFPYGIPSKKERKRLEKLEKKLMKLSKHFQKLEKRLQKLEKQKAKKSSSGFNMGGITKLLKAVLPTVVTSVLGWFFSRKRCAA